MKISLEDARSYLEHNNRAIMITHRRDGGLQTSLIRVQLDGSGHACVSVRGTTAKARNLLRDNRATFCLLGEQGSAPWMHIEGTAEVVALPAAMPLLEDFYRRRTGKEHDNWDEFRRTQQAEQRAMLVVTLSRANGPDPRP